MQNNSLDRFGLHTARHATVLGLVALGLSIVGCQSENTPDPGERVTTPDEPVAEMQEPPAADMQEPDVNVVENPLNDPAEGVAGEGIIVGDDVGPGITPIPDERQEIQEQLRETRPQANQQTSPRPATTPPATQPANINPRPATTSPAATTQPANRPSAPGSSMPQPETPGSPGIEAADPTTQPAVETLGAAWQYGTDAFISHEPLVDEQRGRVYAADWQGNVFALSLEGGSVIWQRQIAQPDTSAPWYGFAGTGVMGEGLLFEASVEGTAYAINPEDGSVVWQTDFTDDPQAGNAGEIAYHDGMVYIGISSYEEMLTMQQSDFQPDFRGEVIALRADDGSVAWRLTLAQPPADGVAVWSGFAVDAESDTLYFTTSNNYTEPNELSDAIVAADANTGELKWAVQVVPNDVWTARDRNGPDYAFAAPPVLFDADGRRAVGAGNKDGRFYAMDAQSGEPLWQAVVGYGGLGGGVHGTAVVQDGRVFVWSNNAYEYGKPAKQYPLDVAALDAATGEYVWINDTVQPASTTGGGVIAADAYFTPSLDGIVRGYSIEDGVLRYAAEMPQNAPVSSTIVQSGDLLLVTGGLPNHYAAEESRFQGIAAFHLPAQATEPEPATQPTPTPTTQTTTQPAAPEAREPNELNK